MDEAARAAPHIPVQALGRLNILSRLFRAATGKYESTDHSDFADVALLDEFSAGDIVGRDPPVRPDLDDAVGGTGGVDHSPAFHNRMADGFFHIDVCAGLDRRYSTKRMPMVGRGHDGNIRLFLLQQFSIVFVLFWFFAGERFHFFSSRVEDAAIHVAHRDHFAPSALGRYAGDIHAPPAAADKGGAILFVVACPQDVGKP